MNTDTLRYRRMLRKNLHCTMRTKKKLLSEFDHSLSIYLDDTPFPSFSQLETAFGSPSVMSAVLLESVSDEERAHYHKRKKQLHTLWVLFAIVITAYTLYVHYIKEYTIIETYSSVVEIVYTDNTEPVEE